MRRLPNKLIRMDADQVVYDVLTVISRRAELTQVSVELTIKCGVNNSVICQLLFSCVLLPSRDRFFPGNFAYV